MFSGGTTAMQPSRFSLAQHIVDVSIGRQKAILSAEFARAFDLEIASRGQQDFIWMRGFVSSQRDGMPAL